MKSKIGKYTVCWRSSATNYKGTVRLASMEHTHTKNTQHIAWWAFLVRIRARIQTDELFLHKTTPKALPEREKEREREWERIGGCGRKWWSRRSPPNDGRKHNSSRVYSKESLVFPGTVWRNGMGSSSPIRPKQMTLFRQVDVLSRWGRL